jgi:hypothetical protein
VLDGDDVVERRSRHRFRRSVRRGRH